MFQIYFYFCQSAYIVVRSIVPEQSKAVAEPLTGSWPGVVTCM